MATVAEILGRACGSGSSLRNRLPAGLDGRRAYFASVVCATVERLAGPAAVEAIGPIPAAWKPDASLVLPEEVRDALDRANVDLRQGHDLFRPLYENLFSRKVRHAQGEYYTPEWLVDQVLDAVGFDGTNASARLLDPTCGSGAFLVRAIGRLRARRGDDSGCGARVTQLAALRRCVVGMELDPLAVLTARANWLLAVRDLLPDDPSSLTPPIFQCDAVCGDAELPSAPDDEPFDLIVGNPPWIAWDNLPSATRTATLPLWRRYGLFSLDGNAGRHGGAKKDLSMLVIYCAADRYLVDGGRVAMIVSRSLLQTRSAGEGFRRFRLGPDGPPLRVVEMHDFTPLRPFRGAASQPVVLVLEKGRPTVYPVPVTRWHARGHSPDGCQRERLTATPIDPTRPGSPWAIVPETSVSPLSPGERARVRAGTGQVSVAPEPYRAHLGANTGGANGVYWIELLGPGHEGRVRVRNLARHSRAHVESVEAEIEPGLIYPLLRWRDVGERHASPSAHLVLPQDPERRSGIEPAIMHRDFPATLEYLGRFEPLLRRRAAYRRYQKGGPFYSMYNVCRATLAPIKVVWRRMDTRLRAAVVTTVDHPWLGRRPVVPQETCVLIACDSMDEAEYLCSLLNSPEVNERVASFSVVGGKGFGSPGMFEQLNLPRYKSG